MKDKNRKLQVSGVRAAAAGGVNFVCARSEIRETRLLHLLTVPLQQHLHILPMPVWGYNMKQGLFQGLSTG